MVFDGLADQGDDVGVLNPIDLAPTFRAGGDQARQAQLRQVLAGSGDAGPDRFGQAGHVAVPLREQPEQPNPGRGGQQRECHGRISEVRILRLSDWSSSTEHDPQCIARSSELGVRSPQAAQQRFERITGRTGPARDYGLPR
jgi:hypothetical protein